MGIEGGGQKVEVPANLRAMLGLSIAVPNLYGFVKTAVDRYNRTYSASLDPISVAHALVAEGYKINAIPERVVALRPSAEGIIQTKAEIQRIISEDRTAEFPVLDAAINMIVKGFFFTSSLRELEENIENILNTENKLEDPNEKWWASSQMTIKKLLKHRDGTFKHLNDEELTSLAEKVRLQMKILLPLFNTKDELETRSMKKQFEKNRAEFEAGEKREREARLKELETSKEAAGQWLFGVARNELEKAKFHPERAVPMLAKSSRARDLAARHKFDFFVFTNEQIAREKAEHRRGGMSESQLGTLATLLLTFAKPRVLKNPEYIHNPGKKIFDHIMLWKDAKFASELPQGVYASAAADQKAFRDRSEVVRTRRRSTYDDDLFEDEYDDDEDEEREVKKSSNNDERVVSTAGIHNAGVATLWWEIPQWKQWKYLRPHIRGLINDARRYHPRFTPKTFSEYLQSKIDDAAREIKRQSAAYEHDQGVRFANRPHLTMLQMEELKKQFDLDFVLSKEERDAEIEKREAERFEERRRFSFLRW